MVKSIKNQILSSQKKIWNDARIAAGPRYTADINVELPIQELFDGIGKTDAIFNRISELQKEFNDRLLSITHIDHKIFANQVITENLTAIQKLGKPLSVTVNSLGKDRSSKLQLVKIEKETTKILEYFSPIDKVVTDMEYKESEEQRQKAKDEGREYFGHTDSEELRKFKGLQHDTDKLYAAIRDVQYFCNSHRARLVNEPVLLILGQAGMGKTHLVCDITKNRIEQKLPPTIIVLGEQLIKIADPLSDIFQACSLGAHKTKILEALNELGEKSQSRSLIIVDAINEADRVGWKRGIKKIIKELKNYPWVGLVMTCRTPFEFLSLPKMDIITDYHQGFSENELEAMTVFFDFYGIPLPEVPLLISEFSSPLFLSCFCKTARDIKGGKAKVAKGLKDLALGQVGMTKILEDFYITKEEETVKKYSKTYAGLVKKSWIWNKSGNDCLIKLAAQKMATNGNRSLTIPETLNVIKQLSPNSYNSKQYSAVLDLLIEGGVFIRDAAWDSNTKKYYDVIKFSFHKFSDHIIARYLLENYFDRNKVKASLSAPTPLGNLFKDEFSIRSNVDLIEALMVEFPQRVKKNVKLHNKDLIDFMPKDAAVYPEVRSAFIESLYWRKPENFLDNKGLIKKSIIDYINKVLLRYRDSEQGILNLFVSTATKPFHPLNATRLHRYLLNFSIPSRDLFWSEYLRNQYSSGSVYRLVAWIESQNIKKISPEQAACVVMVLGWVLTSNARRLRDRATRCIYRVGVIQPEACFKAALELLNSNDPYVGERIIAACYGISMALHISTNSNVFFKIFYPFARNIYLQFFKTKAPHATTHSLTRDYARGILEVALYHDKKFLNAKEIKRIRPPYKDGGIRKWGRALDKDKGNYRDGNAPIGMDFENYTLGHLVPNRRNYDNGNKDFKKIMGNAFWRIYELGYSLEKFGQIDKEIVSHSRMSRGSENDSQRIDRYGKKYSWIAYYELLGYLMDNNNVNEYLMDGDGRRIEYDIDPSFPQATEYKQLFNDDLNIGPKNIKKWLVQKAAPDISKYLKVKEINGLKGPWVLVHGTIGQQDDKNQRRITTWITGALLNKQVIPTIQNYLDKTKIPGNDEVPSLPEVRYVFTGELGWREQNPETEEDLFKLPMGQIKVKLSKSERDFYNIRIRYGNEVIGPQEPPKFRMKEVYKKIPTTLLARWFSSKDYARLQSDDYSVGMYIPSEKIIKMLNLHIQAAGFNFLDEQDKVASISFFKGNPYGTHENLLYIREDLLNKIIKKTGKNLCLVTWGERQFWSKDRYIQRKDLSPIYQSYKNVYKKFFLY